MAGYRWSSRLTQFSDDSGDPLAGGLLYFYDTGTSDLQDTYTTSALSTANENPIELDADGRLPEDVFLDPDETYRIVLKNSGGTTIAEDDPVVGSDVTVAIENHEDDPNGHPFATTTNGGFVTELANDAEAQAQTDTARVLTPSNLAAMGWTTTRTGLVEKATDAEAEAGTDTDRGVTPANLQTLHATIAEVLAGAADDKHFLGVAAIAGSVTLSATDLSITLPKVIFKGGKRTSNSDSLQTFTFGTAFPNNCYGVMLTNIGDGADGPDLFMVSEATPPTASGFSINREDTPGEEFPFYFFAWGN